MARYLFEVGLERAGMRLLGARVEVAVRRGLKIKMAVAGSTRLK
jgi:hypothetical protein